MRHEADDDALKHLRIWLSLFIAGLVLSGLTAFPLERELSTLVAKVDGLGMLNGSALLAWLHTARDALAVTNKRYPFLAYGTDWLAFGHLAIAGAFVGLWIDPVRNKWLITWGLITCAAVVPVALVAGAIRAIPFYWRLIDSGFGVIGSVPLLMCRRYVRRLERNAPKVSG